jgi:hypothetical protein
VYLYTRGSVEQILDPFIDDELTGDKTSGHD